MDVSWRRSRGPFLSAHGVDISTAHFEDNPREWPPGRTGGGNSCAQGEASFMTRTVEAPLFGGWNHGTREVRAFLTERDELIRRHPYQYARFMFVGIHESDRRADGDVVDRGDSLHRRLTNPPPVPVLRANPQLPQRERRAGQHHELHEVAALDVEVLRPVDRKILPPRGLCIRRREVRSDGDLLAIE